MKTRYFTMAPMLIGTAALSSLICTSLVQAAGDSSPRVVEQWTVPQSVFVMPGLGRNLKDPFFPNSKRITTEVTPEPDPTPQPTPVDLTLKAISGTAERPLAMINEYTFEVGEERDVRIGTSRIRVRLISVDAEALKVTVSVGNQTRELRLRGYELALPDAGTAAASETIPPASPGGL